MSFALTLPALVPLGREISTDFAGQSSATDWYWLPMIPRRATVMAGGKAGKEAESAEPDRRLNSGKRWRHGRLVWEAANIAGTSDVVDNREYEDGEKRGETGRRRPRRSRVWGLDEHRVTALSLAGAVQPGIESGNGAKAGSARLSEWDGERGATKVRAHLLI
ncbi:hypothetical protein DFH09DRAFT_1082685 [Mycena vulgaris]|nr:hypothetical protein DFH09DRAFT_1082685 [Mycena vulgaris]